MTWLRRILRPPPPADPAADPFAVLHDHAVIAWDLDDTLVGHRAAQAMAAYIRATPEKRHVIVTFRGASQRDRVWRDLAPLDRSHFAALETTDDAEAALVQRLLRQRARGLLAGPETAEETAYLHWKGRVCARLGASVLVDDMTELVRQGCAAHDILLLHPDRF